MLKTIITIFFLLILNGCVQNAALLGPALTGATTGNVLQSGLSYASNHAITRITGKTPTENLINFLETDKNQKRNNETIITISAKIPTENLINFLETDKNQKRHNENANNFFNAVNKLYKKSAIKNLVSQ